MRQTLVSAVVAALVSAVVTYVAIRGDYFQRSVDVPSLVGASVDTARSALDQTGLLLVVAEDREDTGAPPGQVVAQRPLPGSKIHAGEAVNVTVARPPVMVKVPNVVGQLVGEAKTRLEKARLIVSHTVDQTHPTLGVGMVIAQNVPEGAELRAGSGLELKVSKGTDNIVVPSVTGKSLSKAKELLAQAGLVAGQVRYGSNDDRSPGIILDQKPAASSPVPKGTAIDLVVNSD